MNHLSLPCCEATPHPRRRIKIETPVASGAAEVLTSFTLGLGQGQSQKPGHYWNLRGGVAALRARNGSCSQQPEAHIQLLDAAVFL